MGRCVHESPIRPHLFERAELGGHVEGVLLAPRIAHFAEEAGLDTPILAAIAALVGGALGPQEALASLMARIVHKE